MLGRVMTSVLYCYGRWVLQAQPFSKISVFTNKAEYVFKIDLLTVAEKMTWEICNRLALA